MLSRRQPLLSRTDHRVGRRTGTAGAFLALAVGAGFLACGGSASDSVAPASPLPAQIAITPNAPAVAVGAQIALQAQVHDASGQLVPGATVFWSSNDTTIVTVSPAGVVTGHSVGTTQIAASSSGQSAVVPVTVLPVGVASVAIAPANATITVGGTVTLQGIAYDASGNTLSGRTVVWASSAPQVATVSAAGKVVGVAAGKATVTGTIEGKAGSSAITVTVVPVAAVAVSPGSAALDVGQSASFTAVTTDANGNTLTGRTITWASGNSSIATVTSAGLVKAVGAGTTTISAAAEGKTGTAQVVVTATTPPPPPPPTVTTVTVSPAAVTLTNNRPKTLTAKPVDASGHAVNGHTITWSSSDSSLVSVATTGPATAAITAVRHGLGLVTITATCDGISGTSSVTVVY